MPTSRTDTLAPPPAGSTALDRPTLDRRELIVLLLATASLQAVAWVVLLSLFAAGRMGYGLHELADTTLYQSYAWLIALGKWPYEGFPVEYPPLANLVFLVAPSDGTVAEYDRWFSTAMLLATTVAAVLTVAAAATAWRSIARSLVAAGAYAVLTLCCGALALNRYDAVVAVTVAASLCCLAARRPLPASVSLGLGFALKLTPALLLPLVLLAQQSHRRVMVAAAGFIVAAALPFVPFVLNDAGSTGLPFTYHAERPLQLESVLGLPWTAAALLGGTRPTVVSSHGSQNFAGPGPDALAAASPWLLAAAAAAVYTLVWRRRAALRAAPELAPVAALAVLLVAICASKILSPQFLIWTFPVVALCVAQPRRLARAAALLVMLATALTQVEFPARYWDLVALEGGPLALLAARNLLLLASAALAVVAVVTLPTGDRAQPGADALTGDGDAGSATSTS